ncbi:MAG: hypothetical protein ABJM06_14980 [Gilvibacter sp.]
MEVKVLNQKIDLKQLEMNISKSSNFQFAHQFFYVNTSSLHDSNKLPYVINQIADDPELHQFLVNNFNNIYSVEFEINHLNKYSYFEKSRELFGQILAGASNDILGAYSIQLRAPKPKEVEEIYEVFDSLGMFEGFVLATRKPERNIEHNTQGTAHFSSWFYDVAWDYLIVATWPKDNILWLGCLSDTD